MIILEKEEKEIINFLWSQEIYDIFYNNKTLIKEIIEKINNKKTIKEETKININKIFNKKEIIKKILKIKFKFYRKIKKNKNIRNKLIFVDGIGKSTFISIFIKLIEYEEILIYDLKDDIKTIIGQKQNINKIKFINKKIEEDILKNKNKFNLIIFENNDLEINSKNEIIKKADEIILLIEPNLLGIKKAKYILEKYINEINISKNKIKIIFNKITPFSISEIILNQLFSDFKIIGKINLSHKYDLAINCNLKQIDKEIKKEYLKIIKKIGG